MSRLAHKFCLVLFALSLVGCKWINIENGRVPQEFLVKAQEYLGVYHGGFNGLPGALIIALDGDYVKVSFVDGKGNDILGLGCESKIGDLDYLNVEGDSQNPTLGKAIFKFDSNKCSREVHGKTLNIHFSTDNASRNLGVLIVERYYFEDAGHTYLEGMFTRAN